jgi:hypothetical protein
MVPTLKAPPAHIVPAPVERGVILDEIEVQSQGRVYHVRLGMPCGVNGAPRTHGVVRIPSNRLTLFVDCDGSTGVDVLQDDSAGSATLPKK